MKDKSQRMDKVLDDWKPGLKRLLPLFEDASHSCGLRTAAISIMGMDPPPQEIEMAQAELTSGAPILGVFKSRRRKVLWVHFFFGEASQSDLKKYETLAQSAFGNLLHRPADDILPSVRRMEGPPWLLWTEILHLFASDRPTANLNSLKRAYLSQTFIGMEEALAS